MDILIVDDEIVSRTKMQTILKSFGDCTAVDNGQGAIDVFNKELSQGNAFDLITLDINMPDMGGEEVLIAIREIEKNNNIPNDKLVKILMVTSESDKEKVIACHSAGCDDYIIKPFNIETIQQKIEQFGFAGAT